jgi:hypothetical protein
MAPQLVLAIASLAAQVGGTIYSQVKASQAAKEQQRIAQEQYAKQTADAERLKAEEGDFMNTALGKGLVTQLNEKYDQEIKQNVSNGMKSGLTDEAKLANTQVANSGYADALNRISQLGTGYRLNILNQANNLKRYAQDNKYQADMNYSQGRIDSALNLGENIQSAGNNLMNAAGQDWGSPTNKQKSGGGTTETTPTTPQKSAWGTNSPSSSGMFNQFNRKNNSLDEALKYFNGYSF